MYGPCLTTLVHCDISGNRLSPGIMTDMYQDLDSKDEAVSVLMRHCTGDLSSDPPPSHTWPLQTYGPDSMIRRRASLPEDLVGEGIEVYWPDDAAWYSGIVDSYDETSNTHRIAYSDGMTEVLDLCKERYRLQSNPDFLHQEEIAGLSHKRKMSASFDSSDHLSIHLVANSGSSSSMARGTPTASLTPRGSIASLAKAMACSPSLFLGRGLASASPTASVSGTPSAATNSDGGDPPSKRVRIDKGIDEI